MVIFCCTEMALINFLRHKGKHDDEELYPVFHFGKEEKIYYANIKIAWTYLAIPLSLQVATVEWKSQIDIRLLTVM